MPLSATNVNAGTAIVNLMANSDSLQDALKKATSSLQGFASVAATIGNKLQVAGTLMLAPFQNAARVFADFDARMRMVGAVTALSGEEMARLTEKAKELGATTVFSASQVAEGMAALGRMGGGVADYEVCAFSHNDFSLFCLTAG